MKQNARLFTLLLLGGAVLLLPRPREMLIAGSCANDSQCSAPDGACDETTSTCVQCVANGNTAQTSTDCCSGYIDPNTNQCANQASCYGCSNDGSCSTCSGSPACDQSNGACVSCVQDGDAAQSASDCCGGTINEYTGVCETCNICSSDSNCTDCSEVCDLSNETCGSCVPTGDTAQDPSECCSGFANYDNGYQCE